MSIPAEGDEDGNCDVALVLLGLPDHGSLLTVEMHGLLAPGVDVGLLNGGEELGLDLSANQ